jgi:hypothetical protein
MTQAVNITQETARRHYLDVQKVRDKYAIRRPMPGVLLVSREGGDDGRKNNVA